MVNMLRKLTVFSQRYPSLSLSASTAHRATHLVVVAGTEQDVVGRGVPLDQPYAPAVPMQLQERLHHVPLQPTLGDLPEPHLQRGWGPRLNVQRGEEALMASSSDTRLSERCLVRSLLARQVGRARLRLRGGSKVFREERGCLLSAFGTVCSKKSLQTSATIIILLACSYCYGLVRPRGPLIDQL